MPDNALMRRPANPRNALMNTPVYQPEDYGREPAGWMEAAQIALMLGPGMMYGPATQALKSAPIPGAFTPRGGRAMPYADDLANADMNRTLWRLSEATKEGLAKQASKRAYTADEMWKMAGQKPMSEWMRYNAGHEAFKAAQRPTYLNSAGGFAIPGTYAASQFEDR